MIQYYHDAELYLFLSTITQTNKMVPISTASSRSFTSSATPTAFAVRRSSRARAVPLPTKGFWSPASDGRPCYLSFTRRSYTRAGEIYYRNYRPSVIGSSSNAAFILKIIKYSMEEIIVMLSIWADLSEMQVLSMQKMELITMIKLIMLQELVHREVETQFHCYPSI